MTVKRIFQSATMNPTPGTSGYTAGSPSGVALGGTYPATPLGSCGTATFPAISLGSYGTLENIRPGPIALLVQNNGPTTLRLFFTDGQPAPTLGRPQIFAEGTGTLLIPAGKYSILTAIVQGCGVSYIGGPFSVVPGNMSYVVELSPADHPAALVTI